MSTLFSYTLRTQTTFGVDEIGTRTEQLCSMLDQSGDFSNFMNGTVTEMNSEKALK